MADSQKPKKRSACDRCRSQKLRCHRDDSHPNDFCTRCVRSQVECITSSSKRPGRPTKQSVLAAASQHQQQQQLQLQQQQQQQQHQQLQQQQQQLGQPETASDPCSGPGADGMGGGPAEMGGIAGPVALGNMPHVAGPVDDCFNFGPLDIDCDMPPAYWGTGDSTDMYPHGFAGDAGSAFTMSSLSSTTNGDTPPLTGMTDTLLNDSPVIHSPAAIHTSTTSPTLHRSPIPPRSSSLSDHHHLPMTEEPALRISALYRDLCQQILILRTIPWDPAKVLRLTADGGGTNAATANISGDSDLGGLNGEANNPLANISRSSAEFADILRTSSSPIHDTSAKKETLSMRRLSTGTLLNMPDLLATISCHILIVSIYDTIFSHCIAQFLENPSQSGPTLFLGGIAVPTRPNMLGHLLFRVLDSQLRPIEELLGLPPDLCVSWKRESSSSASSEGRPGGLFSTYSSQSLFTALVQMEMERTTDKRGGLGAIESLKDNARRVQHLDSGV